MPTLALHTLHCYIMTMIMVNVAMMKRDGQTDDGQMIQIEEWAGMTITEATKALKEKNCLEMLD